MGWYSNRAMYSGKTAPRHGRGLYSTSTGRMLYAGRSWVAASSKTGKSRPAPSQDSWTRANYDQEQLDSMYELRNSPSLMYDYEGSTVTCSTGRYGYIANAWDGIESYLFYLPAGARGTISRVKFRCNVGNGFAWDASPTNRIFANTTWDDTGGRQLKMWITDNWNRDFRDKPSGELLDNTPPLGMVETFANINAYHINRNRTIIANSNWGSFTFPVWEVDQFGGNNTLTFLNTMISDSFTLVMAITKPTNPLPYYADPATGYVNDNSYQARAYAPAFQFIR